VRCDDGGVSLFAESPSSALAFRSLGGYLDSRYFLGDLFNFPGLWFRRISIVESLAGTIGLGRLARLGMAGMAPWCDL
jgi:hypothetical protein